MSFDKHSNFNKQANFTEVKFGENKPVLEVELNELQQIQNEARADIIRDTIPSGFTKLGEIDYDYCLNNENKIKLKTDSVAYVNGYRINIPKDTIIDIGEAPKKDAREDLLFLEVWREEVNSESKLTIAGGEGQPTISNTIKDKRYPIETTHRVALKWRIRHVANVDFSLHGMDGLERLEAKHKHGHIHAQGGLTQPPFTENQCAWTTEFTKQSDDIGLYKTSNHVNVAPNNDNYLNTVDNQSYAIPMFRLYRKPSCGKSTPFEYSKINPKVDYSKFAKLMKEEKVERIVTENIKGRSLVNLLNPTKLRELGWGVGLTYTFDSNNCILTNPGNNDFSPWGNAPNVMNNIPSSRVFTLILENIKDTSVTTEVRLYNASRESKGVSNVNIAPHNIKKLKIQTEADTVGMSFKLYSGTAPSSCKVMALEGDWTNKEIPEFFTGLKSLGEDDGNLVTVKNGILNDNTYDINDGNQKLATFPQVTHVLSENTVIPEIQAKVKKGEEVTESFDKLGTKLTTEGIEEIEFSSIRGRTIQNCYPIIATESFNSLHGTVSNGYVTLQGNADYQNAFIPVTKCLIKPNTNYTMIVNVTENTLTKDFILTSTNSTDVFKRSVAKVLKGKTGTQRFLVISAEQIDTTMYGLRAFLSENETGKIKFNIMLLEGNCMSDPLDELAYIEGIKSVGETENNTVNLSSCGKNILYRDSTYATRTWLADLKINEDETFTITKQAGTQGVHYGAIRYKCKLKEGKKYQVSLKTISGSYSSIALFMADDSINVIPHDSYRSISIQPCNKNCEYIDLLVYVNSEVTIGTIQIEEGETKTTVEPHKEYNQNLYLKEPLRSLPNGVYDEIVGNKVIRKVGTIVLDGGETWIKDSVNFDTNTLGTFYANIKNLHVPSTSRGISDKFVFSLDIRSAQTECFGMYTNGVNLKILKSKVPSLTATELQTWLSKNPVTIHYELATPTEEYLENVYEKESIKTYQLDAPLRSLPNGVKDEIKDGVLIRRCEEIILNGSESWSDTNHPNETSMSFCHTPKNYKQSVRCLCDKFAYIQDVWNVNYTIEGISMGGNLDIRILKSKLEVHDVHGFRKWLKANPIKVVYALNTPVEIPLTEVKPQTADFSLQRQLAEGEWLRELPNGIKDTIENGKVKRRIGKVVLNGKESWTHVPNLNTSNTVSIYTNLPNKKPGTENFICTNFITSYGKVTDDFEKAWAEYNNTVFYLRKYKTSLSTPNEVGLKSWLSQNPIIVLYELAEPTTEDLTTKNCNYYPYHDFNTYCGSMYVGERRNYILSDNKMPSEDSIIIETDFREINGKTKVKDCKYKKCDDGYSDMCLMPTNKNLFDGVFEPGIIKQDGTIDSSSSTTRKYSKNYIRVIPGETYIFSANKGEDKINLRLYDINRNLMSIFPSYSNVFTIPTGCYYVRFYNGHPSDTDINTLNAQFEIGTKATTFIHGKNVFRSYENTEKNDIEDLRHQVSLTGFNYDKILNESFDKLLRGEL